MNSRGPLRSAPSVGTTFDEVIVPHLSAAQKLARWLIRDEHDAEDAVQDAALRAFRHFRTFSGGDARAWFLRIVRNTCYDRRHNGALAPFDEARHSHQHVGNDPETILLKGDDVACVSHALSRLPERFRRLLVLREIEGLSYRELATAIDSPIGTVMSRLSRARAALRVELRLVSGRSPAGDAPRVPPGHEGARRRASSERAHPGSTSAATGTAA